MEVIPFYRELTSEDDGYLKKMERKYEPSCSGLVIHLGLKKRFPQLAHHNFFYAGDQSKHFDDVYNKKKMPTDPTIYLVAPTRTDSSIAPADCEVIKILPHIPHIQDEPYQMSDYLALKDRVYDKLERMGLDGLRESIIVEDMLIPDDIERMYRSNRGSIYGVVGDRKKNSGFRIPKKSDRYEKLWFVGGSVNPGSGMPMVILSGMMVADMIDEEQ
jgi:diapolycopene oxygenase